jgi:transposase
MDGARYHKRRAEAVPSSNSRKQAMIDWLQKHEIECSPDDTRKTLYDLITKHKGKVPFACVEIAKEFGHEILYTPPYHCELQPIETVWGIGKNRVATQSRADDTGPMVRDRLLNEFARIRSADLVSVWKKSVQNCQDYFEREGTQELPIGIGDEEYESDESALDNEFDDLEGDF